MNHNCPGYDFVLNVFVIVSLVDYAPVNIFSEIWMGSFTPGLY